MSCLKCFLRFLKIPNKLYEKIEMLTKLGTDKNQSKTLTQSGCLQIPDFDFRQKKSDSNMASEFSTFGESTPTEDPLHRLRNSLNVVTRYGMQFPSYFSFTPM